jgi:hypothetical protein
MLCQISHERFEMNHANLAPGVLVGTFFGPRCNIHLDATLECILSLQSRPQMFIPLAPQTSGKGEIELLFLRFVYTLRINILTCAQPKIAESWMTPQNLK